MIDVQPMVDAPSPLALTLTNALTSRYEKLSAEKKLLLLQSALPVPPNDGVLYAVLVFLENFLYYAMPTKDSMSEKCTRNLTQFDNNVYVLSDRIDNREVELYGRSLA